MLVVKVLMVVDPVILAARKHQISDDDCLVYLAPTIWL
jgi:hypothetical protein